MEESKITEFTAQLARLEEQVKAAFKRIDEQKQLTESVHKLALSIERLTSAQQTMDGKLSSLSADVEELKEKPRRRWDAIVAAAISAIVGLLVGRLAKGI